MENNKNKKSVTFQGDMLNFCDFIQVFAFTRNHYLYEQEILFDSTCHDHKVFYATELTDILEMTASIYFSYMVIPSKYKIKRKGNCQ